MPEFKRNFTAGKMNKDLNERLIPKGEYRDAMNIEVSTSEGSDVGTVQNILGNKEIGGQNIVPLNSVCVGTVADERNDALYWFTTQKNWGSQGHDKNSIEHTHPQGITNAKRDIIWEYKDNRVRPVFCATGLISYVAYHSSGSNITWNTVNNRIQFPFSIDGALLVGMNVEIMGVNASGNIENHVGFTVTQTAGSNVYVDGDIDFLNNSTTQDDLEDTKFFFSCAEENTTALNFDHDKIITGINIIDNMLFWTDGYDEPKKINIPRSMEGTSVVGGVVTPTKLINQAQDIAMNDRVVCKKEHITVIRKAPKTVLTIQTETDPNFAFGTTLDINFLIDPSNPALGNVTGGMGASFSILLLKDATSTVGLNTNDVILFNPALTGSGTTGSPPNDTHEVSGILTNQVNSGSADYVDASGNVLASAGTYVIWDVAVQQISFLTTTNDLEYNWAVKIPEIEKFKNKFTRFSYRYKYLDGEYSSYAPFTPVVFKPKNFKYNVKEAYNIGMENNISKIVLSGYNSNLPLDVSGIELLYKESHSPVVYSIDTIRKSNNLTSTTSSYEVRSNQIKAALPENQLLRPWDNVPRTSLAQEVTGSRIVYGNYLQNYNIKNSPILNAELVSREDCDVNSGYKSLKSMRNYTLGVSYLDEYGRQSPVFTNKSAVVQIPINKSNKKNQVSTTLVGNTPDWAKHYKVFIKQTADEYYNMAMDRIYDAKDGNIWLSFPSSDRNKIDDETFLILKKGVDDQVVSELNRYKVLAIENEAPTFIKTKNSFVSSVQEDGTGAFLYFTNPSSYPIEGSASISIEKSPWDTVNIPLSDIPLMTVQFTTQNSGGATQYTQVYDVTSFAEDVSAGTYDLSLDKGITEDWVSDAANVSLPDSTIGIRVSKKTVENRPEFDGRFFVKVTRDIILDEHVISQGTANQVEQVAAQLPFYYLADGLNGNGINTTSNITSNDEAHWNTLLDPTGNGIDSMWFIDSAFYSGYYDDGGILQNCGVIGCGTLGMTHDNRTNPPTKNETGYKKGIYTEGGQAYIDLSFGYIKAADGPGATSSYGYAMHTDSSDTDRASDSYWSLISTDFIQGGPTTGGDPNCFFQEVGDHPGNGHDNWESNDDLIKHWKVGSGLNTNHNSDENVAIVTKLVQNSRFRFTNDPNQTVYTISGTPEVTYNFNYKNLGSYYDNMHQLFEDIMQPGMYDQYTGLTSYSSTDSSFPFLSFMAVSTSIASAFDSLNQATKATNKRVTWKIPITCEDGPDDPTDAASSYNPLALITATTPGTIQFVEKVWESIDDQVVPDNPAIWETEPKLDVDLDIYYEVDGTFPLEVNTKTNYTFAPVGSSVSIQQPANETPVIQPNTTVVSWRGDVVELSIEANNVDMGQNMQVVFSRADGSCVTAKLKDLAEPITLGAGDTSFFLQIEPNVSNEPVKLSWFNCYSFGNGVESNRIRDDYNQVKIDKGVKASSTLDEPYQEEHRKHGLIYSGLYNSTSGVNELNQFIAAEKITKDLNPTYGSIQKLKAGWGQGGDLIALCEDRVLKILANKDALFNADGNSNVTSTNRVLGQAIPYSGEYGISTNPESFASEAYRAYFTDRVRGTVMRLSMDGLTPISNYGMSDWFKDNLRINNTLVGNFDDKKNEYNLSLRSVISVKAKVLGSAKGSAPCGPRTAGEIFILTTHEANKINVGDAVSGAGIVTGSIVDSKSNMGGGEWELTLNTNMVGGFLGTPYGYGALGSCDVYWWTTMYIGGKETPTISFAEKVKGWSSFKSFIPEQGKSMANNYYTFKSGKAWVHHAGTVPRNTFYGGDSDKSWVEVVMNDIPSSVKSFKAVDYEGSQAKVTPNLDANNQLIKDGEYFNLLPENGWYVSDFYTNLENGSVTEFVEKEGKWFGHTIGSDISINDDGVINNNYTTSDFSVQGVGGFVSTTVNNIIGCMCDGVLNDCFGDGLAAFNYSPAASTPCGGQADPNNCCIGIKLGCIDSLASNFDPLANTDDGSCVFLGCIDEFGPNGILNSNYDPNANASDSSCIEYIPGCTDSTMFNFSATATIACGGDVPMPGGAFGQANNYCCVEVNEGCIDSNADQITPGANTNNNTCTYTGCTDPLSPNYDFAGSTVDGTTSNQADLAYLYGYAVDNGQCNTITPILDGCTDPTADNYQATATNDDGGCYYCDSIPPITPTPISADPTTLVNNYFEASVVQDETLYGAQDGIINIAIPSGSPFGSDSNPTLTDSNGNIINYVLNMGGVYVFNPLAPGDYDITITQGPTGPLSNPDIPCTVSFNNVITIDAASQVYGCTDGDGTFNNHIMSDGSTGTHYACNYNPLATPGNYFATDCDYSTCVGCMDSTATNYDSNYTIPDNGECSYSGVPVYGCTDATATNYDAQANSDDGSCTYASGPLQVGDTHQGGIVAYIFESGDAGYVAGEQHGIIVATTDNTASAPWGCYGTALYPGANGQEIGDGSQNTIDIMAGCADTPITAEIASNYTDGTYTDWFLPSNKEIDKVYYGVGHGGTGTNSNGVSNVNIANISSSHYWSSSEENTPWIDPTTKALSRDFSPNVGYLTYRNKAHQLHSRSVRYF